VLIYPPEMVRIAMMIFVVKYTHYLRKRAISDILEVLIRFPTKYNLSTSLPEQMPRDPRSYEKVICNEIEEEQQILCPSCSSAYPMSVGASGQLCCNSQSNPRSKPCGRMLYRKRGNILKPLLLFRYRKFDDWIRRFLERPGMSKKMDPAWHIVHHPPVDVLTDFWHGTTPRNMKGPDNVTPFSSIPDNETRILFSLAVDWFNPYHNRISGKSASTGVLFMTCLNLPLKERFKEENVYFVGVMPGRKQQSHLDNILKPLVDDLLRYWGKGAIFIGIPGIDSPRLVRCALAQLICDLPAARKVAGFPSHNATCHCSVCFSTRSNIVHTSLAHDPSLRRDVASHMAHAFAYKTTLDDSGRQAAEKLLKVDPKAVRWSELNRLPYWDPIQYTVLDAMHLILLGLCQFHWRKFWGCDFIPKSQGSALDSSTSVQPCIIEENRSTYPPLEGQEHEIYDMDETDPAPYRTFAPTGETLGIDKMDEARIVWISRSTSSFENLSIAQILCLLKENRAPLPSLFLKKDDLVRLLIVRVSQVVLTFSLITLDLGL
jgi:hypothetical protein